MSTSQGVTLPNGKRIFVFYNRDDNKADLLDKLQLEKWEDYCESNWLSPDAAENLNAPEHRVKAFLSGCAYILLRDRPKGTLTTYKEMIQGTREVPVSSCPAYVEDDLYSDRKPPEDANQESHGKTQFEKTLVRLDQQAESYKRRKKKKPKRTTRFGRVEEIKASLPNGTFSFCRVDTENRFEYDGSWYEIDQSVEAYKPKTTKEGLLYDMDQIVIVQTPDRKLHFFDQILRAIDEDHIYHPD